MLYENLEIFIQMPTGRDWMTVTTSGSTCDYFFEFCAQNVKSDCNVKNALFY